MAIKQSTLEQRWYYRSGKVLLLGLPSLAMLLGVVYGLIRQDFNFAFYAAAGLSAYLIFLKIIWRTLLYIVFGGLENDIKHKNIKAAQQSGKTVHSPTTTVPNKDSDIGFLLAMLIIIGIIYYMYYIWKPTNSTYKVNSTNTTGTTSSKTNTTKSKSECVPTGCGTLWRCDGAYYLNGVQVRVNGCLPRKAGEIYSGWSGTCRQCPN